MSIALNQNALEGEILRAIELDQIRSRKIQDELPSTQSEEELTFTKHYALALWFTLHYPKWK